MRLSTQATILLAVIFIFFENHRLNAENKACKIWVQTEIVAILLEFPFMILQTYILRQKGKAILDALHELACQDMQAEGGLALKHSKT